MSYAGDITPQQAWELLREHPEAVLVDVRTDAEWRYVGVPDTSAIDRRTVLIEWVSYPTGARNESFVDQLVEAGIDNGSERPVVFLCRSGQRSIGAAEAATAAGIGPSYNVLDGFEGGLGPDGRRGTSGWRAVGLPWTQS
ncbi:rhodanese-like domain-containing protein [Rhodococcus hoagii]|nr:rhodanese-like domain-containing protein [Prescottella equi]NKR44936.1 rhodanese-like domain-containing protein [Prescottella equi]NKR59560.1 rhodanese-like domain-containing protein [Prescottella equi]NKR94476.1 rhodanese-like domain-containing protein [Prescottella equi]NKS19861.1 rhodanese-like domain-containing protein [Prescottella equi]